MSSMQFTLKIEIPGSDAASVLVEILSQLCTDFNDGELLVSSDTAMGVLDGQGRELGYYTCRPEE